MKIYVCHSTAFDYINELYEPLKQDLANSHNFILPHDSDSDVHSKDLIGSSDLVLAEVSYPSTGQGIELGWADAAHKPIICIYRDGTKPSGAIQYIAKSITKGIRTGISRIFGGISGILHLMRGILHFYL